MNLQDLKRIGPALDADLKAVFKKHGMTWVKRSATLDGNNGSVSYRITLATTAGGKADVARADWDTHATRFGLRTDWYGKSMPGIGGGEAVIVGLMPKRSKYPVLVEVTGRGQRLYTVEYVQRCLGGK